MAPLLDEKQRQLITLLADGQCHSGEALGRALGISRAAIWKQLQKIQSLGLAVERLPGRGYCLARPVELLDEDSIRRALSPPASALLGRLDILPVVDSTNSYLLRLSADAPQGSVCVAESQSAGRGRRGRAWVSPFASNLYCSILWRFAGGANALEGLSLVVGLVLLEALQAAGIPQLGLKWPNDVMGAGGKLGGVLLEMTGDPAGECQVVIGAGVNLAMPADLAAAIGQPWVDASRLAGRAVSRNALLAAFLDRLLPMLASYERDRFTAYRDRWMTHDIHAGRGVKLLLGDHEVTGIARGVDGGGAFLLEVAGSVQAFNGGEISLRGLP